MPPKKQFPKKRATYKRRYRHRRKLARLKSIIPSEYYFTRSQVFDLNINTIDSVSPQAVFYNFNNADGRNAIVAQYKFQLSQVTDWSEFSNLFAMYKIPAVSMKIYPSCGIGGGNTRDNSQMIIYTMPTAHLMGGQGGASSVVKEENFLVSQVCQKRLLLNNNTAHPISFYMKTKQAVTDDTATPQVHKMVHPQWIPFNRTGAESADHWGVTQRWQSINNSVTMPNVQCKIIVKYYIACKQVR